MSAAHPTSHHHDEMLYKSWVQVLEWMREYAAEKGVRFEKESDFPDFIYRMERPYEVPTTIMVASLSDKIGEPFLIASVSPRHAEMKRIGLRVPGAMLHWHAHWEDGRGLVMGGKLPLDKAKLYQLADRAREAKAIRS
ncbi:MAG TPA: NADH-quinone oxidoreductase subunit 15 [Meiothermus sp.]|jgi:hypothetical protein|nr:NADH-quinone oxidoreductase subunit 15 [Meiothermus sp.]